MSETVRPALLDEAARLDMSVRSSEITEDQAADMLIEFTEGGLTRLGALDMLGNWRAMKAGRPGRLPGKSNLIEFLSLETTTNPEGEQ